ncbi:uncharacterized protein LOC131250548 [Magnolia sinica]|uniref:uncharacterized protein LOC131250548 n=1 Tax=Magnolia sinica TaxID=86752 RepID=UPI00265A87BC|nr:uncharacterized protein LOC131250548 [Magnolia sinica]
MVKMLNGFSQVSWKWNYWLGRILLLKNRGRIEFAHIFREGNAPADALARQGSVSQSSVSYVRSYDLPSRIRGLFFLDKVSQATIPLSQRLFGQKVSQRVQASLPKPSYLSISAQKSPFLSSVPTISSIDGKRSFEILVSQTCRSTEAEEQLKEREDCNGDYKQCNVGVNVYINHEKKFAFVDMRTVEELSNAMALDGITFEVYHHLGNGTVGPYDPYAQTLCTECQSSKDENLLLLYDLCDSVAHTYCVGLGVTVPEGDWYCHDSAAHTYTLNAGHLMICSRLTSWTGYLHSVVYQLHRT